MCLSLELSSFPSRVPFGLAKFRRNWLATGTEVGALVVAAWLSSTAVAQTTNQAPLPLLSEESVLMMRTMTRLAAEPGFADWEQPGATGGGMGTLEARYALAFATYGMAAAAQRVPAYPAAWQPAMQNTIAKMLDGHCWGYWLRQKEWGGNNPLEPANIMYHGHLQLMGALYTRLSGDRRYCIPQPMIYDQDPAIRFAWDLRSHAQRLHRLQTTTRDGQGRPQPAIPCETDMVWVECNTPHNVAYRITDRLFGFKHARATSGWIEWVKTHQQTEEGWFRNLWMPSRGCCQQGVDSINNTWPLIFYTLWDLQWVTARYPLWREKFLQPALAPLASGQSQGGRTAFALRVLPFAMVLAREMGDVPTAEKLEAVVRQSLAIRTDAGELSFRANPKIPFAVLAGFLLWSANTSPGCQWRDLVNGPIASRREPYLREITDPDVWVRKAVYNPQSRALELAISRVKGGGQPLTLSCTNVPRGARVTMDGTAVATTYSSKVISWQLKLPPGRIANLRVQVP